MQGDIQYVADSFLIERTFKILSESNDIGLTKQAFDLGSILGGIGDSIKQFVGGQIHGSEDGGVTRTVVDFLAPAIFFRLHPILGILVTAAQLFDFDIYSIYQTIVSAILPSIQAGQPVSANQINNIAKAAVPNLSDEPIEATSSEDLLSPLRELYSKGMLKEADGEITRSWKAQPFIPQNSNPLIRMFSFFGKRRGSSLIVGILVWFLKTVLLSAGLLAVGGVAAGALGLGSKDKTNTSEQQSIKPVILFGPKPTGAGSHIFKNNPGDLWIENLENEKPHERVLKWIYASYPDLYEYKDIILRTPTFWDAIKRITQNWNPGQVQWSIPDPFKSRDEILALFIGDVYKTINQSKGT